jgi:ElaB/YqjD/DUF883 family membrane-anchored ribosome-binding protein
VQRIKDYGDSTRHELDELKSQIHSVVEDAQAAAAEQGVSQQAVYFRSAADQHAAESSFWLKCSIWSGVALVAYALASLFLHKIAVLAPQNTYDSIQLGVSKAFVFGVLSFFLYVCVRNFLANRHNEIVNRHRQNALMTYRQLVDAQKGTGAGDAVLIHASACIYSPQPTGYDAATGVSSPSSVIELVTKPLQETK